MARKPAKSRKTLARRGTKQPINQTALARASSPASELSRTMHPTEIIAARELFWHNVLREILTSLSMLCALRPPAPTDQATKDAAADAAADGLVPADDSGFDPSLFDGRLAVMTRGGERVAIADVYPLFACGINTQKDRGLSVALECSVFQIRTPNGHVFTLPLHEIRAFHSLTPELMKRLERAARRRKGVKGAEEEQVPFGFAAFTSMMQGAPPLPGPASDHPLE
jgi:hypothetical protein